MVADSQRDDPAERVGQRAGSSRRVVLLDVDGTLVDAGGSIPASARAAIQGARAQGHLVYLCTGRTKASLWPALLEIGFDGVIASAGGYVEADGLVLAHKMMSRTDVAAIQERFAPRGALVVYEAHDNLYADYEAREYLSGLIEAAFPDPAEAAALRGSAFGFVERMDCLTDPSTREITKAVYLRSPLAVPEVDALLEGRFVVIPTTTPLYGNDCGELMMPGVHKATGIGVLLTHLGMGWTDTIAIGDGHNDLEMLERAGVGIAMDNAFDFVKAHADEVTSAIGDDGIWHAFRRHGLMTESRP